MNRKSAEQLDHPQDASGRHVGTDIYIARDIQRHIFLDELHISLSEGRVR